MVIGGNSLLMASDRPMEAALAHPRGGLHDGIAHRQVRDHLAGDAQRIKHRHGGAVRMLSVRVKRAVLNPRASLPIERQAQLQAMEATLRRGLARAIAEEHDAATTAMISR